MHYWFIMPLLVDIAIIGRKCVHCIKTVNWLRLGEGVCRHRSRRRQRRSESWLSWVKTIIWHRVGEGLLPREQMSVEKTLDRTGDAIYRGYDENGYIGTTPTFPKPNAFGQRQVYTHKVETVCKREPQIKEGGRHRLKCQWINIGCVSSYYCRSDSMKESNCQRTCGNTHKKHTGTWAFSRYKRNTSRETCVRNGL